MSSDNLNIMIGITWSDDVEPNSMSKANRGLVWIKYSHHLQIIFYSILL